MGRALVLNATYEPLSVVSARRAIVLVLSEKADVVHDDGDVVRSERLTLTVPTVVRLRHFVRVPYRRLVALSRRAVFLRDNGRCQYCSAEADSIDHVVPRSRGGLHTWENVVAACRRCNTVKGDRLLGEAGLKLARRPAAPAEMGSLLLANGRVPETWALYLPRPGAGVDVALAARSA